MSNLFSKDENLLRSAPYIGSKILQMFEESGESRISIFDVIEKMKKGKKGNIRTIYYGMMFLYSLDIIDFQEPYVVIND